MSDENFSPNDLSIPMRGKVASLNVAAAGAIALYSAWQAREWEGWAHA
ncbi:MAG: hypothetical protein AAFV33_17870 [Chloroflexota bacterium]